jgi:O-methyltransferase
MALSVELYLNHLEDALLGVRAEGPVEAVGEPPADMSTMIAPERMRNLRRCVETVIHDRVPGDLIETGVWRGGACIYMRGILVAHDEARGVWAADSFAGMPELSDAVDISDERLGHLEAAWFKVSKEDVRANFAEYGLLDDDVHLVEGRFRDTLPGLQGPWAIVRLDANTYEATMDGLRYLYPSLSPGGFVIVDDYGTFAACRRAVEEYRREHGITEALEWIDETEVCWRRRP